MNFTNVSIAVFLVMGVSIIGIAVFEAVQEVRALVILRRGSIKSLSRLELRRQIMILERRTSLNPEQLSHYEKLVIEYWNRMR